MVASTALNYSTSFVLYDFVLKFELWEGNDKTASTSATSFVVCLILDMQSLHKFVEVGCFATYLTGSIQRYCMNNNLCCLT